MTRDANDIAREQGADGLRLAWDTAELQHLSEAPVRKPPASSVAVLSQRPICRRASFRPTTWSTVFCSAVSSIRNTGATAAGKTRHRAAAWRTASTRARTSATSEVTRGRVLYFAGENPDDIRACVGSRWGPPPASILTARTSISSTEALKISEARSCHRASVSMR